jgi:tRNA (guanine-N7-)-methyltransferase
MERGLPDGKRLDISGSGVLSDDLPPLPDELSTDPARAWLDVRSWFDDPSRPLELEIGTGKGTFLAQQAALQSGTNFLGIEYAAEYFRHAADRVRRHALTNVRVLHADAGAFVRWRLPDACCRVIHLYFPDPWPKARHHKRRMVQDDFLRDAWRILEEGGELRVVTDHPGYWAWMEERFQRFATGRAPEGEPREWLGGFARERFAAPASAGEGEVVGTNFERKYRAEGRSFHSAVLRKIGR